MNIAIAALAFALGVPGCAAAVGNQAERGNQTPLEPAPVVVVTTTEAIGNEPVQGNPPPTTVQQGNPPQTTTPLGNPPTQGNGQGNP